MLHTHISEAPELICVPVSLEETCEQPTISVSLEEVEVEKGLNGRLRSHTAVMLEKVRFRRACFEVSNAEEFRAGIACGQATLVGHQKELTDEYLFAVFDDLLRDMEISKSRLVGCVIGLVDALLLDRKTLPPEFRALLRSLK